jgi:hypothetical protein
MTLSPEELRHLRRACDKLDDGPNYRCKDYIPNLLNTVLDFQMKSKAVGAAMDYFEETHGARTHRRLKTLLSTYPNTERGNRNLAKFLWNNGLWTRAKFLRKILECFEERGVKGQKSLERWVKEADFESDVKGQFRSEHHSIGYALFQWLRLRCGANTVKADVHIINFVSEAIHRRVYAEEATEGLRRIAKESKRRANRLDAAIWHYQRNK